MIVYPSTFLTCLEKWAYFTVDEIIQSGQKMKGGGGEVECQVQYSVCSGLLDAGAATAVLKVEVCQDSPPAIQVARTAG